MNEHISSKEISFLDLFRKYHYTIVIPSIQRDYAQGRQSEKATKIRKDFVRELKNFLLSEKSHSLDFIYGSAVGECFKPLDGQQRLTTLWLLHLYLGSLFGEDCKDLILSYETRDSSTRFCKSILEHSSEIFTLNNLRKEVKVGKKNTIQRKIRPSELIQDEAWWFQSWNADPTVKGMLSMLDEIDEQCFSIADKAYHQLFQGTLSPIVFEFLPLDGFHDIDDLYIKMNARGLLLTEFEIFKSKLIEDVENFLPEMEKSFKADIDVTWSDALWQYRHYDGISQIKNIDIFLKRALKLILANEGPLACTEHDWNDKELSYLFEAKDKEVTFAHNWYESKGLKFEAPLLRRVLDDLKTLFDPATTPFSESNFCHYDPSRFDIRASVREWILPEKYKGKNPNLTYDVRLKIHAYMHFIQQFPGNNEAELAEWMRIVYNLAISRQINNSEEMVKALKEIEFLLANYVNRRQYDPQLLVNEWLATTTEWRPQYFEIYQWEEEVFKAKMRRDVNWKALIERAESHSYLDGQIGVTLYLANYVEEKTPLTEYNEIPDFESYKKTLDQVLPLFDKIGDSSSEETKEYLMVKALLSKGDYMPWSSSYRKNIYNQPGHRDYSWKRLFLISKSSNVKALHALKAVINDEHYQSNNIHDSLIEVASHHSAPQPYWIDYLLGEYGKALLDLSKQGFLAFCEDDNQKHLNVLIYKESQRNHIHYEFMSKVLSLELENKYHIPNVYQHIKSGNDDCYIEVRGVEIIHWNDTWMVGKGKEWETFSNKQQVIEKILALPA